MPAGNGLAGGRDIAGRACTVRLLPLISGDVRRATQGVGCGTSVRAASDRKLFM
jgi:hypothetical protein